MPTIIEKKQKIPAPVIKKCLNEIFGFILPCKKNWKDLAMAFPNEQFSAKRGVKLFLRQYVWIHCHHRVLNYQNPFRRSCGTKLKNILLDNTKQD